MIRSGVDIVSLNRISVAVDRFGSRFENRILTPGERKLATGRRDGLFFLAGRFAAKEAVYKAAGIPSLTWQRVEILPEEEIPVVWIDGEKREDISVSISHEREFAVAMAIRIPSQLLK